MGDDVRNATLKQKRPFSSCAFMPAECNPYADNHPNGTKGSSWCSGFNITQAEHDRRWYAGEYKQCPDGDPAGLMFSGDSGPTGCTNYGRNPETGEYLADMCEKLATEGPK